MKWALSDEGAAVIGAVAGFFAWVYWLAWITYPRPPYDSWWLPPTALLLAPVSSVAFAVLFVAVVRGLRR